MFRAIDEGEKINPENFFKVLTYTDNGFGIDGALRAFDEKIVSEGAGILNNDKYRELFDIMLTQIIHPEREAQKFYDDNYTTLKKMSIMSNILSSEEIDFNSPEISEMIKKMKDADPQLFELVKNNPDLITKLQSVYGKVDIQDITMKLSGTSESIEREKLFSDLEKFTKYYTELFEFKENNPNNFQSTIGKLIAEAPKEDVSFLSRAIISVLEDSKENENFYSAESIDSRKEIFRRIIKTGIEDDVVFTRMTMLDLGTVKDVISEFISDQDREGFDLDVANTVIVLGKKIKSVELEKDNEPKLLDADKVNFGELSEKSKRSSEARDEDDARE